VVNYGLINFSSVEVEVEALFLSKSSSYCSVFFFLPLFLPLLSLRVNLGD
jgi:hypothetical protein